MSYEGTIPIPAIMVSGKIWTRQECAGGILILNNDLNTSPD